MYEFLKEKIMNIKEEISEIELMIAEEEFNDEQIDDVNAVEGGAQEIPEAIEDHILLLDFNLFE